MKIHILSDLHTEQWPFNPSGVDSDVVVLAGDIGVGLSVLDWIHEAFPSKPVVYVAGNH